MDNSKRLTVSAVIIILLAVGAAGWYIPELYDSTGLNQSSRVAWSVFVRAIVVSALAALAFVLAWFVCRSVTRQNLQSGNGQGNQFSLRTLFVAITAFALAVGGWMLAQEPTEFWFVGLFVTIVLVGMAVGRATYLASGSSIDGRSEERRASKKRWMITTAGVVVTGMLLAICWRFDLEHGYVGIVWLFIFGLILAFSPRPVGVSSFCYLAAILLPFLWLIREMDHFNHLPDLLAFISAAPGIVPAAMTRWTPNSLALATTWMVALSLTGLGMANWGRLPIAVFSGIASSIMLYASFGLHAMFRA